MIVKIKNLNTGGWIFYDNVLSVRTDQTHCIKKMKIEQSKDYPEHYQSHIIGTCEDSETGVLKQNENVIYFPSVNLISDFEDDNYMTENIFLIKIIELEMPNKEKVSIAAHDDTPIFLLSNEGKTIDRI